MFTCHVGFIFLIIMHNRFYDISEYLVIQAEQQDQTVSFWLCSNVVKMTSIFRFLF